MVTPLTDELNLIERARSGDASAFESLISAYAPELFRVVRRMASDDAEAEAIVQETLWRTWQTLERYQTDRPFFPFLVTIALNLQRDQWKKERNLDPGDFDDLTDDLAGDSLLPETLVTNQEALQDLAQAVEGLTPAYRRVISLRYQGQFSYMEIADLLKLPINTVRTHLRRALMQLRQMLEEKYV
jgi:RNA polymerase sigma-70 factor, ECF subfamily